MRSVALGALIVFAFAMFAPAARAWKCESWPPGTEGRPDYKEIRCSTRDISEAKAGIRVFRQGAKFQADVHFHVSSWLSACGMPGVRLSDVESLLQLVGDLKEFVFPEAVSQMRSDSCFEVFVFGCYYLNVTPGGKQKDIFPYYCYIPLGDLTAVGRIR